MRRWLVVWVWTVLVLLAVWGTLAVLSDSMTTQARSTAPNPDATRVVVEGSAEAYQAVVPQSPYRVGGTAVVPDGWSVERVAGLSLAIPPDWAVDDDPWTADDRPGSDAGWRSAADLVGPGEQPAQVAVADLPASWADTTRGWTEQHVIPVPGAEEASLAVVEQSTGSGGTVLTARVVVRQVLDGPAHVVDLRLPPDAAGGLDLLDALVGSLSLD